MNKSEIEFLQEAFNNAKRDLDEAFEKVKAGIGAINRPKTISRKALCDERIFIVEGSHKWGTYTVSKVDNNIGRVDVKELAKNENEWHFIPEEYEVIVEEEQSVEVPEAHSPKTTKTNNQQRAELIENAKEDLLANGVVAIPVRSHVYPCTPIFEISKTKRTVTCRLRDTSTGFIRKRATTKCHPDEVFNEDIGKIISLRMAMELDIPEMYMNAVQPTEKVLGMIVDWGGRVRKISKEIKIDESCHLYSDTGIYGKIIDDTDAEYNKN